MNGSEVPRALGEVAEGWETLEETRGADDGGASGGPVGFGGVRRGARESSRKGGRVRVDRVVAVDVAGHGGADVVLDDEGAIFGVRRGSVSTNVVEHDLAEGVLDETAQGEVCPTLESVHGAQEPGGSSDVHGIVELRQRDEL